MKENQSLSKTWLLKTGLNAAKNRLKAVSFYGGYRDEARLKAAEKISLMLHSVEDKPLPNVCLMVQRLEPEFIAITPPQNSRLYNGYQAMLQTMKDYCNSILTPQTTQSC